MGRSTSVIYMSAHNQFFGNNNQGTPNSATAKKDSVTSVSKLNKLEPKHLFKNFINRPHFEFQFLIYQHSRYIP